MSVVSVPSRAGFATEFPSSAGSTAEFPLAAADAAVTAAGGVTALPRPVTPSPSAVASKSQAPTSPKYPTPVLVAVVVFAIVVVDSSLVVVELENGRDHLRCCASVIPVAATAVAPDSVSSTLSIVVLVFEVNAKQYNQGAENEIPRRSYICWKRHGKLAYKNVKP